MDLEVLKSYLVSLGFNVNAEQQRQFQAGLDSAQGAVTKAVGVMAKGFAQVANKLSEMIGPEVAEGLSTAVSTVGKIIVKIVEFQAVVVGAFVAVSVGILKMADDLAMADQGYRLFALRMFMTKDAAERLMITTKMLGASLAEIAWDPELHRNALILFDDQKRYQAALGEGFNAAMRGVRNLRFEFTRLHTGLTYLAQGVVASLFEKMAPQIGVVTSYLRDLLKTLGDPVKFRALADSIATQLVPVLLQTWELLKDVGKILYEAGVGFTNLIGLLSGDTSIEGTELSFEKLAKAVKHVVDAVLFLFHAFVQAELVVAHLFNSIGALSTGKFKSFKDEILAGLQEISAASLAVLGVLVGTLGGMVLGFLVGGPIGALIGAGVGAATGGTMGYSIGKIKDIISGDTYMGEDGKEHHKGEDAAASSGSQAAPDGAGIGTANARAEITRESQKAGVDPRYTLATAQMESSFQQTDQHGNTLGNPDSSAKGMFQLTNAAAREMNVDARDVHQNIVGGVKYFAKMMKAFNNDSFLARAAYYIGEGGLRERLRNYGAVQPWVAGNVAKFESIATGHTVSMRDVNIHIAGTKLSHDELRSATTAALADHAERERKQTQRNIAQLAHAG